MKKRSRLCDINPGEEALVRSVKARGSIRRRLQDIGLVENTVVSCVGRSPLGDPSAYLIRGAVIALRREDSKNILLKI
jgi:ferrous iron transport protein A